jgi:adenine-specific DNA-methyltransferase
MATPIEKLDLRSMSITDEKHAQLKELFPEVFTEGGRIDFDRLKLALGELVDVGKERYGMVWPGKADCFKTIQRPSVATLRPCRDESVNFDATENMIIEGDNLEVLKLLQKAYLGKIKMIYIDPPYNTGNDFIYPDNYTESLQTYLEYTGQVDAEGRKFSTNTEADGRFHSKWLNMMYPRLYLARNLLRDHGAIFISIADNEIINLRKICDEIFGEENFVSTFVWDGGRKNDSKKVSVGHEYVVCYSKRNEPEADLVSDYTLWRERKEGIDDIYRAHEEGVKKFGKNWNAISESLQAWFKTLPESHPAKAHDHYRLADSRGVYFASDLSGPDDGRKNRPRYEVRHPKTNKPVPVPARGWRWEEPRMREEIAADRVHFGPDESAIPNGKVYLKENEWQAPSSVFYKDRRAASAALRNLMEGKIFDFPKDTTILARFISLLCREGDYVLDFFAGSGSTAEAALQVSAARDETINFILVQLPEPCENESPASNAGFKTIADILRERARRTINKLNAQTSKLNFREKNAQDRGFRAFRLDTSCFIPWKSDGTSSSEAIEAQLELHVEHVQVGASSEDILCEILLKSGFPLTSRIEKLTIERKHVYSISEGAMLICLDKALTYEVIKGMVDRSPERVVSLDEGFAGNDQLKTNTVQLMKSKGIVFRTI